MVGIYWLFDINQFIVSASAGPQERFFVNEMSCFYKKDAGIATTAFTVSGDFSSSVWIFLVGFNFGEFLPTNLHSWGQVSFATSPSGVIRS